MGPEAAKSLHAKKTGEGVRDEVICPRDVGNAHVVISLGC